MRNTKKIIASLAIIVAVGASAVTVTRAYFSDSRVTSGNTFSTGTVTLGGTSNLPLNVTGLGPGLSVVQDVQLGYIGSLNADIYLGVSGTSTPSDSAFLGGILNLVIYDKDTSTPLFNGLISGLSLSWLKIADNIPYNTTKNYRLTFSIGSGVTTHQGVTNNDTVLKLYAVQTGGGAPSSPPFPGVVAPF